MNKVILAGNLTKDPEIRYTQSGKAYYKGAVGVTRTTKNQDGKYDSDFFNLVAWDKTAELIGRYTQKGSRILVEGRLQTSSYEKNGEKRYSTEVVVERMEFADSKGKSQREKSSSDGTFDGEEIPDDEMPF